MFLAVMLLAIALGACDRKTERFFLPVGLDGGLDPTTGDIVGLVTVDGIARSGVTVTIRQGTTVVDMTTTGANGGYGFLELDPGPYTVSISTITGATCPGDRTAAVVADDETEIDFACTTTPTTGTVTGTVTSGGSPVSNATASLDGRTATTDANGAFMFTDVDPGTYTVSVTASGLTCTPQTTNVTAGQTSTVPIACAPSAPSGSEIAANPYRLTGTLMGTDGCGFGATISNPGPITIRFDPVTNTLTIESDADVAGIYVPGQGWTGMGETTISSGGMTFILRETAMGTWQRSGGTIVLPGTLRFETFFTGGTKLCESAYNTVYEQLVPSSIRFKSRVTYLLPHGVSILGLEPVAFRYREPYGDPTVPRVGLIAENVLGVFPDAVGLDADGEPLGIYYGTLQALVGEEIANRGGRSMKSVIANLLEAF